tara:strand:- start:538 stop:807 length:270 start_codon:yes stop_codon:yes gene_type:complete
MIYNNPFTCGPFLSASINTDLFSKNVYYSYLLSSSLETYVEYENKIKSAIAQEMNEEYIAELEKESQYFSGLLDLALSVNVGPDGDEVQ